MARTLIFHLLKKKEFKIKSQWLVELAFTNLIKIQ